MKTFNDGYRILHSNGEPRVEVTMLGITLSNDQKEHARLFQLMDELNCFLKRRTNELFPSEPGEVRKPCGCKET